MTTQETIDFLKKRIHDPVPKAAITAQMENEAFDIAISALQKQIPMKPVKIDVKRHNGFGYYIGHSLICPACEKRLGVAKVKHCGCGQALLWEETK